MRRPDRGAAAARRAGGGARHRADRGCRDVACGACGLGQQGRRPAHSGDHRVRRRGAAACGRDRARDLHSEGDRAQGAGHVLGARHADGVVAPGFRAHAVRPAGRARQAAGRCGVRRSRRGRPRASSRATASSEATPISPSSPTCAMSARSTRSPFRCAIRGCSSGDFAPLRALFDAEHDQRYGQAAPDERLEIVNVRLVVTAARARHAGRALAVRSRGRPSRRSRTPRAT